MRLTLFARRFAPSNRFARYPGYPARTGSFYVRSISLYTMKKDTLSSVFSFISSFLSSRAASGRVLSAFVSLTSVFGMGTGGSSQLSPLNLESSVLSKPYRRSPEGSLLPSVTRFGVLLKLRPRPISTASLQTLRLFHSQPIYLIVCKGSYSLLMRSLISGRASRLDAFSVYPFRMRLSGRATGVTTGTPLIRPLRSSRTRSSFPQTSCARDGYEPNCLTTF